MTTTNDYFKKVDLLPLRLIVVSLPLVFWSFILGVVIFVILTAIPYIGWLFNLLVIIFGLGALFLLIKDKITRQEMLPAEDTVKPE